MTSISGKKDPVVRKVAVADVVDAFGKGLRDFQALPLFGLMFGALYAAGGMVIILSITALGMIYLAFPLAAGFTLIGPFVAAGLYEVSRQRERGHRPTLRGIRAAIASRSEMGWMAFVTVFIFIVWIYQARLLMALFLGLHASFASLHDFLVVVLTTNEGLLFFVVGNMIGAVLSVILFSLTVVSFPLLLDRGDVDFVTAMITSVRAVTTSPLPMFGWALTIVVLVVVSVLPFFLGLLVTLPVIGHTTWHLYRRIVPIEGAATP